MRRLVGIGVCALLAVGGAWAQGAASQGEGIFPKRPVELQKLRAFDGTWQADVNLRLGTTTYTGPAQVRCNPVADGWAELCMMTINLLGQRPLEGIQLFSYDAPTDAYRWATTFNSGQSMDFQFAWQSPTNARAHGQVFTPRGTIDDLATFHWRSPREIEYQEVATLDGSPYSRMEGTFHRAAGAQSRPAPPSERQRPPERK